MYYEASLAILIGFYLFETYLSIRQYLYVQRASLNPPKHIEKFNPPLIKSIDTYRKSQRYTLWKSRFGFVKSFYSLVETVCIFKFGILPALWNFCDSFFDHASEIKASCLFIFIFTVYSTVTSIPWSLFHSFVIEEEFGFNKMTLALFVKDTAISFVLGQFISLPLIAIIIKVISSTGPYFYFYVWLIVFLFSLLMLTVYPVLIQPLFNKVEPLEEGSLRTKIENLAKQVSFPLTKLFVIDGSKRSGHSNAYMYGFFNNKRIVLYDTLIEQNTEEETVAVLAHELGHWKLWHTIQFFIISQIHILSILYIFGKVMHIEGMYVSFGFETKPIIIGLLIFSYLFHPIDQLLDFFMNIFSRKNEYEADAFAVDLGYGSHLISGLIKINTENLGNLTPDWLYSTYHYSHPPMVERLQAIVDRIEKKK